MEIIIQVIAFLLQFLYKEKLNKVSAITILLFSARFSLIIPTFVPSVLPQNGTKNKRGTREYAQADYQGIELFEDIRLKVKVLLVPIKVQCA